MRAEGRDFNERRTTGRQWAEPLATNGQFRDRLQAGFMAADSAAHLESATRPALPSTWYCNHQIDTPRSTIGGRLIMGSAGPGNMKGRRGIISKRLLVSASVAAFAATAASQVSLAFGSKTFTCDGTSMLAYSDNSNGQTVDGSATCQPRVRWRYSDGTYSPYNYGYTGGIAYTPAPTKARVGATHGGHNDFDVWVTTTT